MHTEPLVILKIVAIYRSKINTIATTAVTTAELQIAREEELDDFDIVTVLCVMPSPQVILKFIDVAEAKRF